MLTLSLGDGVLFGNNKPRLEFTHDACVYVGGRPEAGREGTIDLVRVQFEGLPDTMLRFSARGGCWYVKAYCGGITALICLLDTARNIHDLQAGEKHGIGRAVDFRHNRTGLVVQSTILP